MKRPADLKAKEKYCIFTEKNQQESLTRLRKPGYSGRGFERNNI